MPFSPLARAVFVCALGYLVDVFDIQLFAVLRVPSLTDLGVGADRLTSIGGAILNAQMLGMVLGAFLWGWLGDRFGRLKALYGSIIVYSIGTLLCSLVQDIPSYGLMRFLSGFGLAGETGAATTLIAEMMPAQKRVWGVIAIAGAGQLGPVFAILVSAFAPWRTTYIVAGLLGLAILALRLGLREPALFQKLEKRDVVRGAWKLIFNGGRARIFLYAIMTGWPLTYVWFLLNFFSAELAQAVLRPGESFVQKYALLAFYLGASCGDFASGAISQYWKSRRKAIGLFFLVGAVMAGLYLGFGPSLKMTAGVFYAVSFVIGLSAGCWVLATMLYAEQFGTNIRATTAIVLTNFARGSSIPVILVFQQLRGGMPITQAALLIGAVLYAAGFFALSRMRETHGIDLDYIETQTR